MEEKALELEPKVVGGAGGARAELAAAGRGRKGARALRAAWKRDPYNVRTYNLLNLYDDVIAKQYVMVEGTPFRFRVSKKEEPPLLHYVKPMVKREYDELVDALRVYAARAADHRALRGFRSTSPCVPSGCRVSSRSASRSAKSSPRCRRWAGNFNWGMMLWHEVAPCLLDPDVARARAALVHRRAVGVRDGSASIRRGRGARTPSSIARSATANCSRSADLNAGFTRARDVLHMVVTYHQAAEEVMFLVRRWGFDVVKKALALFAQGKDTADVIPAITGLDVKAYDAAFEADLRARLKPMKATFFVRPSDFSDVEALRDQLAAHPNDARAKGLLALALVTAGQGEAAQKLIDNMSQLVDKLPMRKSTREMTQPRETGPGGGGSGSARKDRAHGAPVFSTRSSTSSTAMATTRDSARQARRRRKQSRGGEEAAGAGQAVRSRRCRTVCRAGKALIKTDRSGRDARAGDGGAARGDGRRRSPRRSSSTTTSSSAGTTCCARRSWRRTSRPTTSTCTSPARALFARVGRGRRSQARDSAGLGLRAERRAGGDVEGVGGPNESSRTAAPSTSLSRSGLSRKTSAPAAIAARAPRAARRQRDHRRVAAGAAARANSAGTASRP